MCSLQQLQFVGLRAWRTQQLQLPSSKSGSLVVLVHMLSCPASCGSSQTRDQTHVPCIGRPTPDQQNYHESLVFLIIYLFSTLRSSNFLFILNLLVNIIQYLFFSSLFFYLTSSSIMFVILMQIQLLGYLSYYKFSFFFKSYVL